MPIDFAGRADLVRANIKSMEQQVTSANRSGDLDFVKELKHEIQRSQDCLAVLERLGQEYKLLEMRTRSLLIHFKDIVSLP